MDVETTHKKRVKISPEQMLVYVERRLAEWGHWYSRGDFTGLGYPPCAIEYRLMKGGIVRTARRSPQVLPVNENAEAMEKLVGELSLQNSRLALALRQYYFDRYSLRRQAEAAGISHTRLKALLDQGKQWIAGWLSCQEKGQR